MTTTDELRRMLEERGVSWGIPVLWGLEDDPRAKYTTIFNNHRNSWTWRVSGYPELKSLSVEAILNSPEEVIEATIGTDPDTVKMLHDRMNAALIGFESALGIGDVSEDKVAIAVPFVAEMHAIIEDAAMISVGSCYEEKIKSDLCEDSEGHWLSIRYMKCSECGAEFEEINGRYWFCPYCGKRIKVRQE